METVAEHDVSVLLSSHLVADIERVCDYLVVLVSSRVQLAGEVDDLLATHHRLIGPRDGPAALAKASSSSSRATPTARARCSFAPTVPIADQRWTVEAVNLEDLVLAYMSSGQRGGRGATSTDVAR